MDPIYTTVDGDIHPQRQRENDVLTEVKAFMRRKALKHQREADFLFAMIGRNACHGVDPTPEQKKEAYDADSMTMTWALGADKVNFKG